MEIIISARHFNVSQEMRDYVTEKLGKIAAEYPKLTNVRVVMEIEKGRHIVEIHQEGKNLHLDAGGENHDMYIAFDVAAEKLDKQLRRHLDKIQDHRVHKEELESLVELVSEEELEVEEV